MNDSSLIHTRYNCTCHIVFIPKYRRKAMYGEARKSLREIISKLCEMKGVKLIEGAVAIDHIHMFVSIPPKIAVSEFMGYLKGKSALMVFGRHPQFRTQGGEEFLGKGMLCGDCRKRKRVYNT